MRASRAYIAGVGTTSVLVASAVLLLAVVSALVAFQGWPGTGVTENKGSLVVDKPERLAVGPGEVASNAAAAAAAVARSPAPGTAAAAGSSRSAAIGTADVRTAPGVEVPPAVGPGDGAGFFDDPPGQDNSIPPSPPDDQLPGGLLPETPLSPQVNRVTDGLGDTTQGLTDNLGGTVGRLNPQLGDTVTATGRMLAELLRSLGRPRR